MFMIPELTAILKKSIAQCLEDRVGVAFSGGIDSSLIAHVAKEDCEVELFTCGTPGSEDMVYAQKVAQILRLNLNAHAFTEEEILDIYGKCFSLIPGDLLKVELLVPVYAVCTMAKAKGIKVLLFGSASEELFVGYERYYRYVEEGKDLGTILKDEFKTLKQRDIGATEKICRTFGIEARFPFYDKDLAKFVFAVPIDMRMEDKELKKGLLREAAKFLGLDSLAVKRKKRAMQYGSGIHKILLRHSKEINGKYVISLPEFSQSLR